MLSNNYVNTISHKPYFMNSHDYTNVYIVGNEVLKTKIKSPYTNITNVHVPSINNTNVYSPYNSIRNVHVPHMFTDLIIVLQILMYHL